MSAGAGRGGGGQPPITGRTPVYAVVGAPIAHSLSPALHNGWLAEAGLDGVYVALPADVAAPASVVPAVRALGLAGANLTVPFKQAAVAQVERLEPAAAAIGAVNTLYRSGGVWVGANTDAAGFVDALRNEHGDVVTGARVVLLGAGGAARAVAWGLAAAGAARVDVLNRTEQHARDVIALTGLPGVAGAPREEGLAGADLLVVATAGGGATLGDGWRLEGLTSHAVVCDLNYWNAAPPLLTAARARGLRTQDGLGMLIWQAAAAFERFTGVAPDPGRTLRSMRPT